MKELLAIQTQLVANKDKHNGFGKYDYRSLETIMNSVKPLLLKTKCTLTFSDELILIGDRYYIRSVAKLTNESGEYVDAVAWAREQDTKAGMDQAQITGSASSYARKYAACSLLGISDGFDPDAMDNREEGKENTELNTAIEEVNAAKDAAELTAVWKRHKALQKNPTFKKAVATSPVNPNAK